MEKNDWTFGWSFWFIYKIFRSDLFKHIDGIALIPPLSCIFKKNNKILNSITSTEAFIITKNDLEVFSINGDYLNVTLRLFESQGWIKRKLLNNNSIQIKIKKMQRPNTQILQNRLKNTPIIKEIIRLIKTVDLYLLGEKSFMRKAVIPTKKSVMYFEDVK